jgi:hypothetical protein
MITIQQLIELVALGVFAYFTYQVKEAVELFKNMNYSNYKGYKQAIREGEKKIWKPKRSSTNQPLSSIRGDRSMITTEDPSGVKHTAPADVSIFEANPEDIMRAIDDEFTPTQVRDNP